MRGEGWYPGIVGWIQWWLEGHDVEFLWFIWGMTATIILGGLAWRIIEISKMDCKNQKKKM